MGWHSPLGGGKIGGGLNDILAKAFTLQDDGANLRQHDGVEDQRAHACLVINCVNLILHCPCTALIFDKRQRNAADRDRELRHHRVTQDLGGDGRTIRNIKYVTINSIIHFVLPVMQT